MFSFCFISADNPPVILCRPDMFRDIPCDRNSVAVDFRVLYYDDDCGTVIVTYSSSGATNFTDRSDNFPNINTGVSTITATATDLGGQRSTCTTRVTVRERKCTS